MESWLEVVILAALHIHASNQQAYSSPQRRWVSIDVIRGLFDDPGKIEVFCDAVALTIRLPYRFRFVMLLALTRMAVQLI